MEVGSSRKSKVSQIMSVKALILDVDGVMTDGSISIDANGNESLSYNIIDGMGIKLAQAVGIEVIILTSRTVESVRYRARQLGIKKIFQGIDNKQRKLTSVGVNLGIKMSEMAYIGDDLADLGAMRSVGLPIAVANAVQDIKDVSTYVTTLCGGQGAIREAVEWILLKDDLLSEAKRRYLAVSSKL